MPDGFEEVRGNTMAFGKVGDFIQGTLVSVNKMNTPDIYGKRSTIYGIKAAAGLTHPSDKETKALLTPITIKDGEMWSVFSNEAMERQMANVAVGQIVMIKFTESKPSTKGHPAKIKKVYVKKDATGNPEVDKEWLASQKDDGFGGM